MKGLSYILVDVFTDQPFGGNPLAVFKEEQVLSDEIMQNIAKELNLSETTFIFPSSSTDSDKQVRIFTPQVELPVAGHPTIGTAFALASEGWLNTEEGLNNIILEEGVGKIEVLVHRKGDRIVKVEMKQPIPAFGRIFDDVEAAANLLSLSVKDIHTEVPIQSISSGVPFLYIPVHSLSAMQNIHFRRDVWERSFAVHDDTQHIFVFTTETVNKDATVHGRMFAPAMGIHEDPATGNASGPLGAYLIEHSLIPYNEFGEYTIRSEQGMEMGRPSLIDITIIKQGKEYKEVKIGGDCVKVGSGEIFI